MNSGAGHKASFGSGGLASSRIGVKGERSLGGDLKVLGLAEAGVLLDTGNTGNASVVPGINNSAASSGGQLGTGSQLFSRQVYAGLASGRYGSVTIGRQYAGSYLAAAVTGNPGAGIVIIDQGGYAPSGNRVIANILDDAGGKAEFVGKQYHARIGAVPQRIALYRSPREDTVHVGIEKTRGGQVAADGEQAAHVLAGHLDRRKGIEQAEERNHRTRGRVSGCALQPAR